MQLETTTMSEAIMRVTPTVTVADLATRDVLSLDPDLTLRDAIGVLTSRHISGAPVLTGDRVVGCCR